MVVALSYEEPLLRGSVASFTSRVLNEEVEAHDRTDLDLPEFKYPMRKCV